jgi:hypothetical protein
MFLWHLEKKKMHSLRGSMDERIEPLFSADS